MLPRDYTNCYYHFNAQNKAALNWKWKKNQLLDNNNLPVFNKNKIGTFKRSDVEF